MRQEPETEPAQGVYASPSSRPASPPPTLLHPPQTASDQVVRQVLVARLSASTVPLVVISAPAGSGKTTVLSQWAESEPRAHAWLQLEAAHNDPLVLLASVVAALEQVADIDPMVPQWAHLVAPPLRERILPSLRASLMETTPFLFVLDDAQLLTNKASWEILSTLFGAFPLGAQLAVGTRTEPPLPLARLQAARRLLQIDGAGLAFSAQETAELLGLHGLEVDRETAAALQAATEGWAAGISLAALACDGACTADWVAALHGDQRTIARYLTTEVLERQTRPVRSFLLQTSILERLSAGSCRAVTGRDDAGELLARLARDNVFLASLDDTGQWYRYHHLFAELLRSEFKRRDGARLPELHRRAAAWCEEEGQLEEAVRHWLAAREVGRAAGIVCRAYMPYTAGGLVATLRRWIEFFTPEQVLSNPPLTLAAGWLFGMTGHGDDGRRWAMAAISLALSDRPSLDGAVSLCSSQVALRASLAPDGVKRMLADAEFACELEADGSLAWRAGTHVLVGAAHFLAGDNRGAQSALHAALREAYASGVANEITALGYLSLIAADQGRWDEAEDLAKQAMRHLEECELGFCPPTLAALCAQARILARRGDPSAATAVRTIAIALEQMTPVPWVRLFGRTMLAEISLDLGDIEGARRWTDVGWQQLAAWPDAGILRGRLERLRRALEQRQLAEPLTPMEHRALELLATHLTSPEIARRLHISRNTLKTHVRGLYLKLDAHSRGEAVERGREIGLLSS